MSIYLYYKWLGYVWQVIREKWCDNTKEKTIDNWKVDKEYRRTEDGNSELTRLVSHDYSILDNDHDIDHSIDDEFL